METPKTGKKLLLLNIFIASLIFIIDINIPLGVACGVPYILLVLISLWSPRLRFTVLMAILGSLLTIMGFFLSPPGGELWKVISNRFLALFAIWVTTILTLYRKKSEEAIIQKTKLIQLLQEVATAANEASTVDEAMKACLDRVCMYTGWPVGHVYSSDGEGRLLPTKIWHSEDLEKFRNFIAITEETVFKVGEGLPGRVLQDRIPIWIDDVTIDSNFPRAKHARDIGVKGAFAFPVFEEKRVIAVLEFFIETAKKPDEAILEAVNNLGIQIGHVTERKRSYEKIEKYAHEMGSLAQERSKQLVHADRMVTIGTLSAGVAHEIGNPIAFIGSNLQIFERLWDRSIKACVEKEKNENGDKNLSFALDEMPKMVKAMREGVKRISTIIRKLCDFSRVEEGAFEEASISECINNAVTLCRLDTSMKHSVSLQINIADGIPDIVMNKSEIEQVLINLYTNAVHAMEKIKDNRKPTLKISAALANDEVVIDVTDNGCGIDGKNLENIFNPFFTTKEVGKGTGLGLSICFGIVGKHRGTIKAASRPGEGATFTITLPLDLRKKERREGEEKVEGGIRKEDESV